MLKYVNRTTRVAGLITLVLCAVCVMLMMPRVGCAMRRRRNLSQVQTMEFGDYLPMVQSGDLILFRYTATPLIHDIASPFSHVGIAIRHPETHELLLLESHNAGDAEKIGVFTGGAHLHSLAARIRSYHGDIWVCRLNRPAPDARVVELVHDRDLLSIPFETKFVQQFIMCLLVPWVVKPTGKKMYCSQFAVHALQKLGIASPNAVKWCASPVDVRYTQTVDGYVYSSPILLKVQ